MYFVITKILRDCTVTVIYLYSPYKKLTLSYLKLLTILFLCFMFHNSLYGWKPRSLTLTIHSVSSVPIFKFCIWFINLCSCCLVPNMMNWVFSSFNIRRFVFMQTLISWMHDWRCIIQFSLEFALDGLSLDTSVCHQHIHGTVCCVFDKCHQMGMCIRWTVLA